MKKIILLLTLFLVITSVKAQNEFITTWKTDNPGTSTDFQITIPTTGGGYNYDVDWGDTNTDLGVTGNITHTYTAIGTYIVTITGTFPRIYFNNGGDGDKLLSIDQWGTNPWTSMLGSFFGCNNMVINATDTPDLSGVTNLGQMFWNCTTFNQDIGNWDVSNVTIMTDMFRGANSFNQDISGWNTSNVTFMNAMFNSASSFDQDLGGWDVSNVTLMGQMFAGVTLSTANYDSLLIGWSTQTLQPNVTFDGGNNSKYCNGKAARLILTNAPNNWTINDGGFLCSATDYFITTWKTDNPGTSNSTSITIPTTGGGYSYDVDWDNDGTFDELGITGDVTHDFGAAGTYTIQIRSGGAFPRIYFNNGGDKSKLLSIDQWGTNPWTSMESSFFGCNNMVLNATDSPDLSGVTSTGQMFYNCLTFNQDIGNWDVSNVTSMFSMFGNAFSFNQDIGGWDVSMVTNMSQMFQQASFFNQDIGGWNVSIVTNMQQMFLSAISFNQNLGGWDVGNVTNMQQMFLGAVIFNQDIGSWNVSNVTNMNNMFRDTAFFNQNIGGWNTSKVTNMDEMFRGAISFNQDISGWNTSIVSNMGIMFQSATSFNQDIGSWDVSNVTNMINMFHNATSFNQDIGSWDVSKVTIMTSMFLNVTLSTANYDNLLIGWSALTLKPNVTFDGGNSKYCNGEAARLILTDAPNSWIITDGGFDCTGLGVEDYNLSNSLSLYPNPSRDIFYVKGLKEKTTIDIYSITGSLIFEEQQYEGGKVDISRLSSGVYFVRITTKSGIAIKKFIKQ